VFNRLARIEGHGGAVLPDGLDARLTEDLLEIVEKYGRGMIESQVLLNPLVSGNPQLYK
jgi:hypothetical protein